MAHFYATIQGQAGGASRIGSARSGIQAHPRGWDVGVLVAGGVQDGQDAFDVYLTDGSNGGNRLALIGTATLSEDGYPVFRASDILHSALAPSA